MADPKQTQKEKSRMVAKQRLAAFQKSRRQPKKRKPVKRKKSWLSKFSFSEISRRVFGGKGPKTIATRDTERQLRRSLEEKDIKRLGDLEKARRGKK